MESASVRVGTMGWGYNDWLGPFYPEGAASRDFITLYAQAFDTVEIDSTFYGTPRASQVQSWAKSTPDGFLFCPKVPRLITHDLRLVDAEEPLLEFACVMGQLGEKLGPMLLQFPPGFTRDELPNLQDFLPVLGRMRAAGARFAIEFRHRSLVGPEVSSLLSSHGIALVAIDYPAMPKRLDVTSDFIYLRLIGRHGAYAHHKETQGDRSADLQRWTTALRDKLDRVNAAFVQCNDDYEGFAPATAEKCRQLLGLPANARPHVVQGSLFDP